ncbi:MAG TPA: ABC transporter permease [Candidatus Angelobacter sp.]|jgi:ABC-2 type transport system permease protein
MNTPSNTMPESHVAAQADAPAMMVRTRPFYWSVRRELWENRSIYFVPLIAAIVFLAGFVINTIILRGRMHGIWPTDPAQQHEMLAAPYELAAVLIMGAAFLVGIFYSLETLYGERRDRSILFWKSLPVSDLTAVLAKVTVPLVILPLLSFAITLITQALMLLLSSLVLLGSGLSVATIWTHSSLFHVSGVLFYHIVTVHGLWYAPIYGWLLFVSAWAPRAPFIWAFLPPFLICGVENLAFKTTYFFSLLMHRLSGPEVPATTHSSNLMHAMSALTPAQFFSEPGLWIGLAIFAGFVAAAVRLRRYRGPI